MAKYYDVSERFGEIIAAEYWGLVPYALYKYQHILEINNSEIWFLTWLFMHQWGADETYPSLNALSRYSGRSRAYIQKIVRSLERKGLLEVRERFMPNGARASNYYNLQPIIEQLEEIIKHDDRSNFNTHNENNS